MLHVACGCTHWSAIGFWESRATRKQVMKLRAAKMTFISRHLNWPEPLSPFTCTAASNLLSGLSASALASYHLFPYHSQNISLKVWVSLCWWGRLKMATYCLVSFHQEMESVLLSFEYRQILWLLWATEFSGSNTVPVCRLGLKRKSFYILSFGTVTLGNYTGRK